jgi:hypothetical protein
LNLPIVGTIKKLSIQKTGEVAMRMRAVTFAVVSALSLVACGEQEESTIEVAHTPLTGSEIRPHGRHLIRQAARDDNPDERSASTAGTSVTTGYGITYHGGPVLHGTVNVYYIWYGNWNGNSAIDILTDFINNFGGSPYYNIDTTYGDSSGATVANSIHYAGAENDAYSRGSSLRDSDITAIVTSHMGANHFPVDPNGVYLVLTSSDVNETSGFCTSYCAWHTAGAISGADIKYGFIGNAARCPSACAEQSNGPNGNGGADAMASLIAHELEETTSDPDINAWYDSRGDENADKCAWTFGTEYRAANGTLANMRLGSRDFLIQQNWLNAPPSGGCALAYNPTPDFSLSVSPPSQSVLQGAATSYTVTVTPTNGFSSGVTLDVSGLPSGATGSYSVDPATGSSMLTVTTAATTPVGTSTLTITGTSGSLVHSVTASLTVYVPGSDPIVNGGFESGSLSGWTTAGTTAISTAAHGGSYAAQLGSTSPTNGTSSLTQTFLVPSSGGTLSFWYKVVCPDSVRYDWATATLRDNNTGVTSRILPKTCTNNGTWVQVSKNLSGSANHSVTLTLQSRDDNYPGDPTYTLYDDVRIQ